jgi:putative nucleotidyltransferase with HDIG domain
MMQHHSPSATRTILLLSATAISLIAQGFWLAPDGFLSLLPFVTAPGNIVPGAILLAVAIIMYLVALQPELRRMQFAGIQAATLLAIQTTIATGLLFLRDETGSNGGEAGFALSGIITLLTAVALHVIARAGNRAPTRSPETSSGSFAPTPEPANEAEGLKEQISILNRRIEAEKHRSTQLTFLNELSRQLEAELEPEVAAQLAVNTLEHVMDCSMVTLLMYAPEHRQFLVLTSAGTLTNNLPPGYRQDDTKGVLGRTARIKKTQVVNDTRADPDFLDLHNGRLLSLISVPILQHSQVKSILEIGSENLDAFTPADVTIAEDVATELAIAWQRYSYHQRLRELIQAGISLTTLLDPQAAVQEVALIARRTLEARFVFVTLLDQQGNFSRNASAGEGPRLYSTLNDDPTSEPVLHAALHAAKSFRVRDVRKYARSKMDLDSPALRSAIAIPIRLHGLSIGAILAFGKQDGIFFSEEDESLANLLASQAAASIESSWLYQELRTTLNTTSMLYKLSVDVIQAEALSDAAELISTAASKLTNAKDTGIVLLTRDGKVEAEVKMDASGVRVHREHPQEIIEQAIQTGQSIIVASDAGSLVCYPLSTPGGTYGALWMKIPESRGQNFANVQTLANQAAVALERSILLAESKRQAEQLKAAYAELEITYDRTLTALMSALDARDRETEGHSTRVSRLACMLAENLGLNGDQIKAVERGALLHDIGKIGITDTILHKPGKLTEDEWKTMRIHPDIGARIVEGIPFLKDTLSVIRYHHERWDGSGYPHGLQGKNIPTQARIFAVADVFDALTSRRTYRTKASAEDAVRYMQEHAGILFDPEIVDVLTQLPYHELTEEERIPSEKL